jgi:hypothetical protein
MELINIKIGDKVVYNPRHLLDGDKTIKDENIGVVTSINKHYAFVKFNGNEGSQACYARDLFFLRIENSL